MFVTSRLFSQPMKHLWNRIYLTGKNLLIEASLLERLTSIWKGDKNKEVIHLVKVFPFTHFDKWMEDLRFYVFSTVFQSYMYQDDGLMIIIGCVRWNPVYGWKVFASSEARTRNRQISRPALNPLSYMGSLYVLSLGEQINIYKL